MLLGVPSVQAQQIYSIVGTVLDGADGGRVGNAIVRIAQSNLSTRADSAGHFRLSGLGSGGYKLIVSADGYSSADTNVTVPGPELTIIISRRTYRLQPVLVTAQIASERKSPVTFSNLSRKAIQDQFIVQDVPVILSQLPSMIQYSENGEGVGYSYVTMRGFDQSRISVMINGIPQNDPEDHNVYWIDVPDLQSSTQSVQVQRGAGSEFYGPPAIGGSINLLTSNFSSEKKLNVTFGIGTTGSPGDIKFVSPILSSESGPSSSGIIQKYSATFSSGIVSESYSFYAHIAKTLSDGYRQDSWVNLDSYFLNATRYDDDATTEINIYGGPIADGLSYLGLPKFAALDRTLRTQNWDDWSADSNSVSYSSHATRYISADGRDTVFAVPRRQPEVENFSQPHIELLNEWKISPSVTLNNSFFVVDGSGFFDYDGSWADTSYFRMTYQNGFSPVQNPTDALIHAYEDLQQFGWLPRITLEHDNGTLVLGSELNRSFSDHWASIRSADNLPADFPLDFRYNEWHARTDVAAFYGHELYELASRTTAMVDLEYEFKQYLFYGEKFVGNRFTVPYHFLNPRIGINYDLSSTSNIYASASRTSHEPQLSSIYNADESSGGEIPHFGLNPDSTINFGHPLVTPETLNDFEMGYGYHSAQLSLGVSAYWMEFYDELISNGLLDKYGQPIAGNAKRTRHVGLELESNWAVNQNISLYGNFTLSRNRLINFTAYSDADGNPVAAGILLDGNRISGFPDLLGNIRATYSTGDFSLMLLGQYVGSQYTDDFQLSSREIDPYFVMSAWISYTIRNALAFSAVEFKLYVNNLFNTIYIAHGEGIYFYPAAERNFFLNCSINL